MEWKPPIVVMVIRRKVKASKMMVKMKTNCPDDDGEYDEEDVNDNDENHLPRVPPHGAPSHTASWSGQSWFCSTTKFVDSVQKGD